MNIVVVTRSNIHPASAGKRTNYSNDKEKIGPESAFGLSRLEVILEIHESEARTGSQSNEDLKYVTFRVPIADPVGIEVQSQ